VVLGAGEAAEGVLRSLHEHGASKVRLLNRRPLRAKALADAWWATAGSWEELDQQLEAADLVVVATGSARAVISEAQVAQAVERRPDRELYLVDLSVPRNVEPDARSIPGVQLFDLDDLERTCCPAAGRPSAALKEAEQVLQAEVDRLALNLRGKLAAPRLAELHRLGEEMAQQESAWALARLESLSEADREIVRQMADRLVRRVLYPVSRNLRENGSGTGSRELGRDSSGSQ
jgi:glutamyl-tRNA reductase